MVFRLRNDRDPGRMVCVTNRTWFSVLELAENHGWRPYGGVQPEWLWDSGSLPLFQESHDLLASSYTYDGGRLVMLEDALNLADALERAFLAYEPERVRSYLEMGLIGTFDPAHVGKPGIGVILEVADLCQSGAFWIDRD
ncbi:MAG TPA: hypothetical protein VI776_05805 [Anaerolineales bacterium]|nr:hypothetical protein [Anaerolineales bacterium]